MQSLRCDSSLATQLLADDYRVSVETAIASAIDTTTRLGGTASRNPGLQKPNALLMKPSSTDTGRRQAGVSVVLDGTRYRKGKVLEGLPNLANPNPCAK